MFPEDVLEELVSDVHGRIDRVSRWKMDPLGDTVDEWIYCIETFCSLGRLIVKFMATDSIVDLEIPVASVLPREM